MIYHLFFQFITLEIGDNREILTAGHHEFSFYFFLPDG